MTNRKSLAVRAALLISLLVNLTVISTRIQAATGTCGGASFTLPFTDVPSSNLFFCSIASAYFSGLTNGTTATTYNPSGNVSREQMAAFVSRTLDQSLRRGSRRAALKQWDTPTSSFSSMHTTVGPAPQLVESDGADLWVANNGDGTVSRVRASDGKLLETWTGAGQALAVLVTRGRIFIVRHHPLGGLHTIDPSQPAGGVTPLPVNLPPFPAGITTDGTFIWTANRGGSVSKVHPSNLTVENFTTGFTAPLGILFDGANVWMTDEGDDSLKRLNPNGTVAQSVPVGLEPKFPVFDGINIWVPNGDSDTVTVVRATGALAGTVLATLSGNGLDQPYVAAFDGERILVANRSGKVSLWKAADLTPIGFVDLNRPLNGACSDGINFWVTNDEGSLVRF